MAVLFTAGDHVPVILLVEVVSKLIVPPEQIGAIAAKDGTVGVLTVTVIVVVVAHDPAVGLKV